MGGCRLSVQRVEQARAELRNVEGARAAKERAIAVRLLSGTSSTTKPPPYGPLHPMYVRNFAAFSAVPQPPPLAALFAGSATSHDETLNPGRARTGSFDIGRVAVWLYPLLVLALCYGILDIERNHAIDPLMLSMPISSRTLLGGRVLARLAMATGLVLLMSVCSIVSARGLIPGKDLALRVATIGIALLLYGAFWVLAATACGLVTRSGSAAIALAGFLWLASVWLVPAGLRWMASERFPISPRTEYVNALRDLPDKLQTNTSELRQAFLARHPEYQSTKYLTPSGTAQLNAAARRDELLWRTDQLEEQFAKQTQRRSQWIDSLSWLTPSMLAEQAFARAAGSDAAYSASVLEQQRAYRSIVDRFYWPRLFEERIFTPADYDHIPRFQFQIESSASALRRALNPVALLLWWLAGAATVIRYKF